MQGDGTINANVCNAGGKISPGCSTGILQINGNTNLESDSILFVEIAAVGDNDLLSISGDFQGGGELTLAFVDGYAPSQGDVFSVLSVSGLSTGKFDEIRVAGLDEGFDFESTTSGGTLEITALNDGTALLLGDVNSDGMVDLLDVASFVSRLVSGTFQGEADINLDGAVDLLDVSLFVALLTG